MKLFIKTNPMLFFFFFRFKKAFDSDDCFKLLSKLEKCIYSYVVTPSCGLVVIFLIGPSLFLSAQQAVRSYWWTTAKSKAATSGQYFIMYIKISRLDSFGKLFLFVEDTLFLQGKNWPSQRESSTWSHEEMVASKYTFL